MRLVVAALLPLLVLRVLVPGGYMLDVAGGTLRMVLCNADGTLPASWSPQTHVHDHSAAHHHASGDAPSPADEKGGGPTAMPGGDCLFAHAAVNGTASFRVACVAAPLPRIHVALHANESPPSISGPPRQTAARAPPVISAIRI